MEGFGLLAKYVEEVEARQEARRKSSKLVGLVEEGDNSVFAGEKSASALKGDGSSGEKAEQLEKGKAVIHPLLEEEDDRRTDMQQAVIPVSEPAKKDASRKIDTEDWMIDFSWELGIQETGDKGCSREEALTELQHKFAVAIDGRKTERSEGLEVAVDDSKYLLKAKASAAGSKGEGSRAPQGGDLYELMIPSRWLDPRKVMMGVEKVHEHGLDDLLLRGEHVKVETVTGVGDAHVSVTEIVSLLD